MALDIEITSINPRAWESLAPVFESLLSRTVGSPADLEQLILDWNLVDAYIGDSVAGIMVAASLDTRDAASQANKKEYLEKLQPHLEKVANDFAVRVLDLQKHHPLAEKFQLMLRILESDRSVFRAENPALNARAAQLAHEYDNKMGSISVTVRGTTYTPPQMNVPMNTPDRTLREELWRGLWEARMRVSSEVDDIFSKQVDIRHQIALNADFENFRDYSFTKMRRFFYTAADAKTLHASIQKHIVPVSRERYREHMRRLGVSSLRPWDIGTGRFHEIFVKPYAGESPQFNSPSAIVEVSNKILSAVDRDMENQFLEMQDRKETDLDARTGKTAGAYQTDFPYKKRPFIFCNNTGVIEDVYTTLHEFGHAYHYLQFRDQPIGTYREIPMEAAELASMGCELIGHNHLELCFSKETASFIRADKYESIAFFLCYMAQVDGFQHWLYENPTASVKERYTKWSELTDLFGPEVDWTGIEEFKGMYWHQQLHLFRYPFYYIEYGIAQLGALQVEANYRKDPKKAVENWRAGLALGASKPLPEIYTTAGIHFDFSEKTIAPVGEALREASAV